ncbi:unnamed protein product [Cylicocyclus nassatus]|uniref:Uncharacterized protein n=1 Tax=Cylicocyclus nassatus TaxID=53992 RepID=A0AA36ME94_CYLNA|nr:unnamed protein product [Cylicocyclus nassatus]
MDKHATQQDLIVSTQAGRWQITDGSATYNIQEHFYPCDSEGSHLRKNGEEKRGPLQVFPDYDVDDRDTCTAYLRMELVEGTGDVHWIQCPTCDNWSHMQCINGEYPGDGTVLLP